MDTSKVRVLLLKGETLLPPNDRAALNVRVGVSAGQLPDTSSCRVRVFVNEDLGSLLERSFVPQSSTRNVNVQDSAGKIFDLGWRPAFSRSSTGDPVHTSGGFRGELRSTFTPSGLQ